MQQLPLPKEYAGRPYADFFNDAVSNDDLVVLGLYRQWVRRIICQV